MYELLVYNTETERSVEMEIEDLEYLKELLKEFDETKVDIELHKKEEKVLRFKL